MYILYLDDSGSVGSTTDRYFVLAGVALFERQTYFLETALDTIMGRLDHPEPKKLELHGSQMLAGRGFWRSLPKERRRALILESLSAIRAIHGPKRLFAVVVDKAAVSPEDPIEYAFEEIAARFDRFLLRRYRENKPERGLVVLDKSTMETRLQTLVTEFRLTGHKSGRLTNFADVPFFVDSRASRLIQYADLVAYALWRAHEKDDREFADAIHDLYDREGNVVHGLLVKSVP